MASSWNSSDWQSLDHANRLKTAMERIMKTAATSCTECGAGDEARPEFMLTMSPPEVAHIEEGIGVPADRCRFGRFDQIYGDVRCPDA
jgi:hypothetical protein